MRWLARVVAVALLLLVVFAGGWWASREALDPPADPLVATRAVTVTAQGGTVGRTLAVGATAEWPTAGQIRPSRGGTVTSVEVDVQGFTAGDAPLTVDMSPLTLARGEVPSYRELRAGLTGPDVRQLQEFLRGEGFDPGAVDGSWGARTTKAVNAWHKSLGRPQTGTVAPGDLVFVNEDTVRVRPVVAVGEVIADGQPVADVLGAVPEFRGTLTEGQQAMVPEGTAATLSRGDTELAALTGALVTDEEGVPYLEFTGPGGGSVCEGQADVCAEIPQEGATSWSATLTLVPEESGVTLPTAALRTATDGSMYVVLADGARAQVATGASADGLVIVTGVTDGAVVELPGAADRAGEPG